MKNHFRWRVVYFLLRKELHFKNINLTTLLWLLVSFLSTLLGVFILVTVMAVTDGFQRHFYRIIKGNVPDIKWYPKQTLHLDTEKVFRESPVPIQKFYRNHQCKALFYEPISGGMLPVELDYYEDLEQNHCPTDLMIAPNITKWSRSRPLKCFLIRKTVAGSSRIPIKKVPISTKRQLSLENQQVLMSKSFFDRYSSFMDLDHSWYIFLDLGTSEELRKQCRDYFESFGYCSVWEDYMQDLLGAFKLEKLAIFWVLFAIFFISMFHISGTLTMYFMEKKRELSLMKILGCSQMEILTMCLCKGVFLGGTGILLGLLSSSLCCLSLQKWKWIRLPEDIYQIAYLPVFVEWYDLFFVLGLSFLTVILFSFIPSWGVARSSILESVRYD